VTIAAAAALTRYTRASGPKARRCASRPEMVGIVVINSTRLTDLNVDIRKVRFKMTFTIRFRRAFRCAGRVIFAEAHLLDQGSAEDGHGPSKKKLVSGEAGPERGLETHILAHCNYAGIRESIGNESHRIIECGQRTAAHQDRELVLRYRRWRMATPLTARRHAGALPNVAFDRAGFSDFPFYRQHAQSVQQLGAHDLWIPFQAYDGGKRLEALLIMHLQRIMTKCHRVGGDVVSEIEARKRERQVNEPAVIDPADQFLDKARVFSGWRLGLNSTHITDCITQARQCFYPDLTPRALQDVSSIACPSRHARADATSRHPEGFTEKARGQMNCSVRLRAVIDCERLLGRFALMALGLLRVLFALSSAPKPPFSYRPSLAHSTSHGGRTGECRRVPEADI